MTIVAWTTIIVAARRMTTSSRVVRPSAVVIRQSPAANATTASTKSNPTTAIGRFPRRSTARARISRRLAEHNRRHSGGEDRLKPGDLISTPPVAQLEKSYPDLCPKPSRREVLQSRESTVSTRHSYRSGRTYTVAEGDTLFNIARYELGKASRWAEIYDLNRDMLGKDFNYIRPARNW